MRKFVKQIFVFCIVLFSVLLSFQFWYSANPYKALDFFYATSNEKLLQKKDSVKILFLGDSYGYYGINPALSKNRLAYFNFAYPSEPIFNTYFKLKYFLETQKNVLRCVYLNANSNIFTGENRLDFNFLINDRRVLNHYCNEILPDLNFKGKMNFLCNEFHFFRLGMGAFKKEAYKESQNEYGTGIRTYHIDSVSKPEIDEYLSTRRDVRKFYNPRVLSYYKKNRRAV